jgi:ATP-dependent Clp protease adaptor protein ClpS
MPISESERPDHGGAGLAVEEAEPKTKQPPVISGGAPQRRLHTDGVRRRRPRKFFRMDRTTATRVMLEVHTQGKGVCGVFTYEIAETKVALVTSYARDHHHPLMCTLEEA